MAIFKSELIIEPGHKHDMWFVKHVDTVQKTNQNTKVKHILSVHYTHRNAAKEIKRIRRD